ncbi:SUKH-4 family immunity protein [Catellatospora citrea]|uniref:SUKH-4 family immunity protein n=1 Tax=Catellatospora citrea TaxID=53366 RepID=UPI0033C97A6F
MEQSGQAWLLLKVEAVGVDDGYPGWLRASLVDADGISWRFVDRATNLVGGDEPAPRSFPAPAHLRCRVRRTERDEQGREVLIVTLAVESVDTLRRRDEFRVRPDQVENATVRWRSGLMRYDAAALDGVDPAVRDVLTGHDLPREVLGIFTADAVPEPLVDSSGARLVRFGVTREQDLICLALDDLSIRELKAGSHECMSKINSSLAAFIGFLNICENAYPYCLNDFDDDEEMEDPGLAAATIRKKFAELDHGTLTPDGYWDRFLIDVSFGDYGD